MFTVLFSTTPLSASRNYSVNIPSVNAFLSTDFHETPQETPVPLTAVLVSLFRGPLQAVTGLTPNPKSHLKGLLIVAETTLLRFGDCCPAKSSAR